MNEFRNQTFSEIAVGTTATFPHRLTRMDVDALALISGEIDPFHVDTEGRAKEGITAEGVAAEALLSALLKRRFPGPGTTIISQSLRFRGDLAVGDEVSGTVTAREKHEDTNQIVFDCRVSRGDDDIASGTVTVAAPTERISYTQMATPQVILRRNDAFASLFSLCKDTPPVTCAVVHPCDKNSLQGALDAAHRGLIEPVLVGPEKKIRTVADAEGFDLRAYRIVPTEHSLAAAEKAVAMVGAGEIESLMKGSLHTDELMAAVVPSATG